MKMKHYSLAQLLVCFVLLCGQKITAEDKEQCPCKDWYGRCKHVGDAWIDDDTWSYQCGGNGAEILGCIASDRASEQLIAANSNVTVDGFWFSCQVTEEKVKYQQEPRCIVDGKEYRVTDTYRNGTFQWICLETGLWVVGCFYKDEKQEDQLLAIGDVADVGVVQHYCDRYVDYPGRVQYYTTIRSDVTIATPTGKGTNKNIPEEIINTLVTDPTRWLPENTDLFIAMDGRFDTKIRYLIPNGIL